MSEWLGDIIGGVSIFALPYLLNYLGFGLGLN